MDAEKIQKEVGAAVLRLRSKLKLSQSGLARRANLCCTYLSSLEAGRRNPTVDTLAALAKALDVSIAQLLESEEQETSRPRRFRLGSRIRKLRRERGLSQAALAAAAQVDRTYLTDIERGHRNPTLRSVARLAGALNISVPALFSTAPKKTNEAEEGRSAQNEELAQG